MTQPIKKRPLDKSLRGSDLVKLKLCADRRGRKFLRVMNARTMDLPLELIATFRQLALQRDLDKS
jgi:hypothetical protein